MSLQTKRRYSHIYIYIGREGEYTGHDNDVVLLRGGENTLRLVLSRPTVASRPLAVVRGRLEFGDRAIVARYLITIISFFCFLSL